jgi:hypothetical protein
MLRQQDARHFMWVPGHGLKIHYISWISFFESPNSIIPCTCSSNLKYSKKINKTKKWTKYIKKTQNYPKFELGVLNNVERAHKKRVKKQIFYFAECWPWHSANSAKYFFFIFDGVGGLGREVTLFCRVLHSTKRAFAECHSLPSARNSVALDKATLYRVHIFAECNTRQRVDLPSARFLALGKFCFSRSVGYAWNFFLTRTKDGSILYDSGLLCQCRILNPDK